MAKVDFPLVKELITDADGQVLKVVLDVRDYEQLLEVIEDEVLFRVMREAEDERPLSKDEALRALDEA